MLRNPSNNRIIAMKTSLLVSWKKKARGRKLKKERDLLFTSTRAFFCIDASAYLILDIALLTVLPDRAGRNAVNGRA